MDQVTIVAIVSIIISGLTLVVGTLFPAIYQGRSLIQGLQSIAQQPDEANTITRTLFVGMALIESFAIYSLVIAMVLIFVNPFWNQVTGAGG